MKILYIHRQKDLAKPSIHRSFEPLMKEFQKGCEVSEIFLPYGAGSLWNIIRNIIFVWRHRLKDGINHVTGETHYAIIGLIGAPSVLTIHDDYAMSVVKHKGVVRFMKWLLFMFLPVKLADEVLCISPATKKKIDNYVSNTKTKVLTHQDMTSDFPYTPKSFNAECPVILHIGTTPNKNLETTLRAVAGIKCKLHVLKKMTNDQILLAKQLNVDYVNKYSLSNEEVFEEYNQADIILFPSLFEGLGMPILEGQSIGRPVITTDYEPMNWVAGINNAMFIKNPMNQYEISEAISLLCKNEQLRNDLIKRGRKNTQRFSLSNIVRTYTEVYKAVLEKHNK